MTRFRRFVRPLAAFVALLAVAVAALAYTPALDRRSTEGAALSSQPALAEPPVAVEVVAEAPAPAVVAPVPPPLVAWGPAPAHLAAAAAAPEIRGESAIVIDETSGAVLFEKDPHRRLPAASLTKIMTALLALERGQLDDRVEVSVDSRTMRGSTVMGLVPGEELTLEDLLYGLMLPSGNDAALAIAQHISGSTPAFVDAMNRRAAELGMVNTQYANPHGLDSGAPYTSAYDLAALSRAAMQREDFRTIVNTTYHVATGKVNTYHLGTLNPLYGRLAGVDGVKTGYTRRARQTLVGSVTRDGHRVLVVVLGSPDRATDGTALLNWAFEAHSWPAPNTVAVPDTAAIPGT